ncbi:MAG: hypothetical protein AAFY76_26575, partial [Cyanobacteria bacterium J06649_11]
MGEYRLKVVKYWEGLPKSKRPTSKSYANLVSVISDPFIVAKLQFFSYVASKVEPYLKTYQTDNPMIPYMYFDLKAMLKSLLEMIVECGAVQKCKSAKQLMNIDLDDKENLLKIEKIETGFSVDNKLIEKNPLGSEFLRSCSFLHPPFLGGRPRATVLERWKSVLSHLLKLNILSSKECDDAMSEFRLFVDDEVIKFKDTLLEFPKEERLDELYFDTLAISKHKNVANVVALILTLFHGQASVERGFSQNNFLLKVNMSPESIISKRIIKDHIISNSLKPYTINVNGSMLKDFRSA